MFFYLRHQGKPRLTAPCTCTAPRVSASLNSVPAMPPSPQPQPQPKPHCLSLDEYKCLSLSQWLLPVMFLPLPSTALCSQRNIWKQYDQVLLFLCLTLAVTHCPARATQTCPHGLWGPADLSLLSLPACPSAVFTAARWAFFLCLRTHAPLLSWGPCVGQSCPPAGCPGSGVAEASWVLPPTVCPLPSAVYLCHVTCGLPSQNLPRSVAILCMHLHLDCFRLLEYNLPRAETTSVFLYQCVPSV